MIYCGRGNFGVVSTAAWLRIPGPCASLRPRKSGGHSRERRRFASRCSDLLDSPLEQRFVERGLEAASNEELHQLLINPVALCQLADAVDEAAPDAWWDDMVATGEKMMERYNKDAPQ